MKKRETQVLTVSAPTETETSAMISFCFQDHEEGETEGKPGNAPSIQDPESEFKVYS